MKRTITVRVEVKDDDEYARVIAQIDAMPEVVGMYMTRTGDGLKPILDSQYGIKIGGPSMSGSKWIQENT